MNEILSKAKLIKIKKGEVKMKNVLSFILRKVLKKEMVFVESIFPLKYTTIDDIQITGKGMMYLKYIKENPKGTMESFEEMYNQMFNKN